MALFEIMKALIRIYTDGGEKCQENKKPLQKTKKGSFLGSRKAL